MIDKIRKAIKSWKERNADKVYLKTILPEKQILAVWKYKGKLFWKKAYCPKTEEQLDVDFRALAKGLKVVMREKGVL